MVPASADPDTRTIHATCIALDGYAALILGPSGSGKSDLALRAITTPMRDGRRLLEPTLVSDDQVVVSRRGEALYANPPATIRGLVEVRGVGIVEVEHVADAEIVLAVDIDPAAKIERLPDEVATYPLLGVKLPLMRLRAFEASALSKLMLRLARAAP